MKSQPDKLVLCWIRTHKTTDLFITTLTKAEILATRNIADFEECGINLINPWNNSFP